MNLKTTSCILLMGCTLGAVAQPSGVLSHPDLFYEFVTFGLSLPTAFEFIADDTILVTQKMNGRVRVVENGVVTGDALDLKVANAGEMGLLGIVKHPDFATNRRIFLFYTRANSDGGPWVEDRLEAYTWNPATKTLTNPTPIIIWGPEGWPPSQYHHGGYMRIGPDQKLYLQHGDMFTREGTMEINDNSGLSGSNASLYRLNLDGTVPADNPFANHPLLNFRRAYVYGMRNGFGLSFDPLTDRLWYTENGPEVYDEVNIALPGMNSGWHLIMGPDERDAVMQINGTATYNQEDLLVIPGSHYADPILSYLEPVGVTFIEFFDSYKYPSTLRNMPLLGSVTQSALYLLPISEDRMSLDLKGPLADRVADNSRERDQFQVGVGWAPVTDARMGPDGYMYFSSLGHGAIYRLRPTREVTRPTVMDLRLGRLLSGGLPELYEDDDVRLSLAPGATITTGQSPISLLLDYKSVFPKPSALSIEITGRGSSPSIRQTVSLRKNDGTYDVLDSRQLTLADGTVTIDVEKNALEYVNDEGIIRLRIENRLIGPVITYPWSVGIDRAVVTVKK